MKIVKYINDSEKKSWSSFSTLLRFVHVDTVNIPSYFPSQIIEISFTIY